MKKKLLIDTDIIIDFLRGFDRAVKYIKSHSEEIVLSVITVAELYAGVKGNDEHPLIASVSSDKSYVYPAYCNEQAVNHSLSRLRALKPPLILYYLTSKIISAIENILYDN